MLKSIDPCVKIDKAQWHSRRDVLDSDLAQLQRDMRAAGIPLVVVIDGLDGAGKGETIGRIIAPLDPRGYSVHTLSKPAEDEKLRPFLWRFWQGIPKAGAISIFDRGWYNAALAEIVDGSDKSTALLDDIASFERTLSDNGTVVVKFYLHISKKEQGRRLSKLTDDRATSWRVTTEDIKRHENYARWRDAASCMIAATDGENSHWHIIPADDLHSAELAVKELLATLCRTALAPKKPAKSKIKAAAKISDILSQSDLSLVVAREEYDEQLDKMQKRLRRMEHRIYTARIPVVIGFEGWDAAGKGGVIKRLTNGLDPRGFEVHPVAAPSAEEKARHYLWRFWRDIPKGGHIGIFDRTWYGRVLVERVEGFCAEADWRRAFREINEFEQQLTNAGTVICKFWMNIDQETQLARFTDRQNTPAKQWKITDEDWRNREKWDNYLSAVNEMLEKTSTKHAPWTIVSANDKLNARLTVLDTVISRVETALRKKR